MSNNKHAEPTAPAQETSKLGVCEAFAHKHALHTKNGFCRNWQESTFLANSQPEPAAPAQAGETLRDPTADELESPLFNAIWNAIKGWDISRTSNGVYSGPTGTDVCTILDAIAGAAQASGPTAEERIRTREHWICEGCLFCYPEYINGCVHCEQRGLRFSVRQPPDAARQSERVLICCKTPKYCGGECTCPICAPETWVSELAKAESQATTAERRLQEMAKALRSLGKEQQFAGQLCWCDTAADLYCVGQPQCKQAQAALRGLDSEQAKAKGVMDGKG